MADIRNFLKGLTLDKRDIVDQEIADEEMRQQQELDQDMSMLEAEQKAPMSNEQELQAELNDLSDRTIGDNPPTIATANDAIENPYTKEKPEDMMTKLQKLKQARDKGRLLSDVMTGGARISEAIARGYGGTTGVNPEQYGAKFAERAEKDLDKYIKEEKDKAILDQKKRQQRIKNLMRLKKDMREQKEFESEESLKDPKSEKSRSLQNLILEKAKQSKMPINEESIRSLSYNELSEDFKNIMATSKGEGGDVKKQQASIALPGGGTAAAVFNPYTGRYELAKDEKGNILKRGYSSQVRTDPLTGELITVQPGFGSEQVAAKLRTEENITQKDEDAKGKVKKYSVYKKMNPNQRKYVNELQKTFLKETKDTRESMDKLTGLTDKQIKLAIDNPIAAGQLGAQVATIFENGRLTDEDVVRYTRRQGLPDKIVDTLQNIKSGTITKSKASDIEESLDVFNKVMKEKLSRRAATTARMFTARSPEYNAGDLAKIIYPYYITDAKIRVKLPDGKIGRIDAGKIDEFKKEYPDAEILD